MSSLLSDIDIQLNNGTDVLDVSTMVCNEFDCVEIVLKDYNKQSHMPMHNAYIDFMLNKDKLINKYREEYPHHSQIILNAINDNWNTILKINYQNIILTSQNSTSLKQMFINIYTNTVLLERLHSIDFNMIRTMSSRIKSVTINEPSIDNCIYPYFNKCALLYNYINLSSISITYDIMQKDIWQFKISVPYKFYNGNIKHSGSLIFRFIRKEKIVNI